VTPPSTVLAAVTAEARAALGNVPHVRLTVFPFRIGREARSRNPLTNIANQLERRIGTVPQLNELYLLEASSSGGFNISREHCAIEWIDGRFMLVDRGSACGSTVIESRAREKRSAIAATQIGPYGKSLRAVLRDGDLIVLGPIESPYVFRFQIEAHAI
jgi:hypothetical protein